MMEALSKAEQAAPQILAHYRNTPQIYKALEEMGELTRELSRGLIEAHCSKEHRMEKDTFSGIQEEIADVIIMALQMRCLFGKAEVDMTIAAKIERTFAKVQEGGGVIFRGVNK